VGPAGHLRQREKSVRPARTAGETTRRKDGGAAIADVFAEEADAKARQANAINSGGYSMTKANDTAALAEFTKYEIAFPFFWDDSYGEGWHIGVRDRGTDCASADAMGALLIETLAIVWTCPGLVDG
jgi:hypothetical protein